MDGEAEKCYQDRIRAMTPEEKLRQSGKLYNSARSLRSAVLRKKHPEWTDQQVRQALNEWMWYAQG